VTLAERIDLLGLKLQACGFNIGEVPEGHLPGALRVERDFLLHAVVEVDALLGELE
jgi:hypothetical protein